jgi:hypothetical protein
MYKKMSIIKVKRSFEHVKALLGPSKKKTFNDLCASFTDACNEAVNLEDSSDDPVNELIDILRNATLSNQNLNESNIAAIKVTNLIIPAVVILTAIHRLFKFQNVKTILYLIFS